MCSTVLTLASALTLPLPVAQAAALPCAAGTPVQGDIDGDTLPDLLIEATDTRINGTSYRWLPGDGGSQSWLDTSADLDRPLHMADLNGDLCMDAVGGVSANWSDTSVVLFLGTPSGLDTAAPIRLGLPRAAQLRDPERLLFTVAGTRHHGTGQIAVTGSVNLESGFHHRYPWRTDVWLQHQWLGHPQQRDLAGRVDQVEPDPGALRRAPRRLGHRLRQLAPAPATLAGPPPEPPYDVPVPERNHLIDLARIGSMLIVVVFHALLWQVLLVDGEVRVVPWAPGPVFWAISWVAAIIPVFFVAAGYANAVVVDSWRASGAGYGAFLTRRGSRLLGPMTLFLAVLTLVGTIAAWIGPVGPAAAYSRQFAQLLWFAVVYQLLLAAAPLAVRLHDRAGAWVMLPLLAGAVAVDVAVRVTGDLGLQWLNLAFVWPLAHQWGIAYHRGWFRTWSTTRLLAVLGGSAAVIVGLVMGLRYPPAAVAWADVLVANLLPPTLAILALGLAQVCVLGLLERAGVASRLSGRAADGVRLANALLLTAYLWHIPAILVAGGLLVGASLLLPAMAPFLMNPLVLVAAVLAAVAFAVPQIARLELRLIPRPGPADPPRGRAELAYAIFAAGTWAVWQCGALLHPGDPPGLLASACFAAGVVLLRRATSR